MKLLGMLDSPYARRVAVSLALYDIRFEHESISVFSQFDTFSKTNPVVKAPTLVLDSGIVLMDSSLILNYVEDSVNESLKLMPQTSAKREQAYSILGFALAACEKAIQYVYEYHVRPEEKRYQAWVDRITQQLISACHEWNKALDIYLRHDDRRIDQVMVTTAVVWTCIHKKIPGVVDINAYPHIQALTQKLEQLPAFQQYPYVD